MLRLAPAYHGHEIRPHLPGKEGSSFDGSIAACFPRDERDRALPSLAWRGPVAHCLSTSTYMNAPPSRRLHLSDLPSHTSSFVLVVVAAILENRPFIDTRSVL
jgi:hypothetical protein